MIPDEVQYFLEHFWNFKNQPNIDPQAPYLLQKYFNEYRKKWKPFINMLFVSMSGSEDFDIFENPSTDIFEK